MADNKSPWDDSNDSPWQGEANTEKEYRIPPYQ